MSHSPKLTAFRNCFEAGMDFETALGCAGLSDQKPETLFVLHRQWMKWEAQAEKAAGELFDALKALRAELNSLQWGQRYPGRPHAVMDRADALISKIEKGEE